VALSVIQRNIRRWMSMKNWQWWKLYTRVKPLLTQARAEDEMKKMQEEYENTKEELEGQPSARKSWRNRTSHCCSRRTTCSSDAG
jgi:myosin heavy subunit